MIRRYERAYFGRWSPSKNLCPKKLRLRSNAKGFELLNLVTSPASVVEPISHDQLPPQLLKHNNHAPCILLLQAVIGVVRVVVPDADALAGVFHSGTSSACFAIFSLIRVRAQHVPLVLYD